MFKCSHCQDAVSAVSMNETPEHFKGKDAIHHIAEVQAEGVLESSEIHGAETPGVLFSLTDAARETAVVFSVILLILSYFELSFEQLLCMLSSFSAAFFFWKIGRASWLSWSRLERLHRVMDEERYEIEVHRDQERVELKALYQAKGFTGKLLDDVVDVLMADGDRLLRVMLEEELGFRLEENDHPLMQGLGAGIGVFLAASVLLASYFFFHLAGALSAAVIVLGISAYIYARLEKNNVISAVTWNVGIAIFSCLVAYYTMQYIL